MARPRFHVQHFMACLNAAWEGAPGPRTLRTLEGVGYWHAVPPDTEFPYSELEVWLYARFYRIGDVIDGRRLPSLVVNWHNAPDGLRKLDTWDLGTVRFSDRNSIINMAWPVRPLLFPGEGLYEFQLLVEIHRP
ncbi:MAG TPA: hypothetical protein VGL71_01005, partial [Urbifossiella sp.]